MTAPAEVVTGNCRACNSTPDWCEARRPWRCCSSCDHTSAGSHVSDVRTCYEAWCTCGWIETHGKEFAADRAASLHQEQHDRASSPSP